MQYHKTVDQIRSLLDEKKVWYETFEHKPVRTSEEAAKVRDGYSLKQGAKAIIIRVKNKDERYFLMLVMPADRKFSDGKVKKLFSTKDIRFAKEEEVENITDGIQPGGVPPFGNLFNIKVVVDPSLFENEKIIFNAGDRSFSIAMKSADFKNITKPLVQSIVE